MPYIEDATNTETMNDQIYNEAVDLRDKLTGDDGVFTKITDAITGENGYVGALNDAKTTTEQLNDQTGVLAEQIKNLTETELTGKNGAIKAIKGYNTELQTTISRLRGLKEDYDKLKKTMADKLPNKIPGEIPAAEKKEDPKPKTTTTTTNTNKDTKPTTNTNKLNKDKVIGAYNEIMSGRAGNGDAR